MKTSLTRIVLASAAIGLFSAGAFAHEDSPEAGPYHALQHLSDARTQASQGQEPMAVKAADTSAVRATGALGPIRSAAGDDWNGVQRNLGGVGGFDTN